MNRRVEWSSRALRDLRRLTRETQERIVVTLARYAETDHGDVRKLKGTVGEYRLRAGDYRVIFALREGHLVILVLRVLDRKDAYK